VIQVSNYNLSGKRELLNELPVKYSARNKIVYDECELQKGVTGCLIRLLLGHFDFVENYVGDNFKTISRREFRI
jgi:hypothetical protein